MIYETTKIMEKLGFSPTLMILMIYWWWMWLSLLYIFRYNIPLPSFRNLVQIPSFSRNRKNTYTFKMIEYCVVHKHFWYFLLVRSLQNPMTNIRGDIITIYGKKIMEIQGFKRIDPKLSCLLDIHEHSWKSHYCRYISSYIYFSWKLFFQP